MGKDLPYQVPTLKPNVVNHEDGIILICWMSVASAKTLGVIKKITLECTLNSLLQSVKKFTRHYRYCIILWGFFGHRY